MSTYQRPRTYRGHCTYIVPTQDNPADLASRGGLGTEENQLWWKGPEWLSNPAKWPADLVTAPTAESNAEMKATKELLAMAVKADDDLDHLLAKHNYWKTLRVCTWIMRFTNNAKAKRATRAKGPLTTDEIEK